MKGFLLCLFSFLVVYTTQAQEGSLYREITPIDTGATFFQQVDSIADIISRKDSTALIDTLINQDTLGIDSLNESQEAALQDTTKKETRAERRARRKEEKEREKYYYKGIKKDSARLEIERVSRAAWRRSIFVPGWGQYTNGGLWWIKVPVIYGGFVTSYLVFDFWQWYYKKFLNEIAYRLENNGDKRDEDLLGFEQDDGLIRQKDYGRRNRDLTILATVGWYGLNIVEAYVDSMLKNRWSISDDFNVKLSPTVLPASQVLAMQSPANIFQGKFVPGLKLTLTLH